MKSPYHNLEHRLIVNSVLDPVTDCWVWIGARNKKGYGRINTRVGGVHRCHRAHILAFEVFTGKVAPPGHEHDHGCLNRACINPAHVEIVPKLVNLARRGTSWA